MYKANRATRIVSCILSVALIFSLVATASAAGFAPITLKAAPTKMMEYYSAANIPASVTWVTTSSGLSFLPAAAVTDVTCAIQAGGVHWIGTKNGLMSVDFSQPDERDIVQYYAGNRYMYDGDDVVTGLASDGQGGIWVRNAKGAVHIRMTELTMQERTYSYEKLINDVNDRRGMVTDNNSYSYDQASNEYTQTSVSTNDNDGLWTAMYALGEIFRYQTLKRENAPAPEIAAAKKAATRATKAVMLLDYVSGRGTGFPCRSYLLKSEAAAALSGQFNNVQAAQNGFWFEKRMLSPGESYPDPIIDEMKDGGRQPIGIATVRITSDALSKKGAQVLQSSDQYNGLGLSPEAIDAFNAVRPEGSKLGTDIKSTDSGSVFPVMVEGINIGMKYSDVPSAQRTVIDPAKIKFRLTTPVYERIPQFFNDLFPASVIGDDGYVDESQIVYKADTSSDEVDGHYALFYTAYKYLCDDPSDPELAALKGYIVETTVKMTDLILKDDHYYIVDATGKPTQWSRWLSEYFNDNIDLMKKNPLWTSNYVGVDEEGEDALSYGYEDGPLNALEVMSSLKIAQFIARDADPIGFAADVQKYGLAYDQCFDSPYSGSAPFINAKGYMDMALEYIFRRFVRQNTDAYGENDNKPINFFTPGNKVFNAALHNDWTQYVNYSDEELGWFPVYGLLELEKDAGRKAKIVAAFDQWYDGQEEREENPFYTFLYQMAHPEKDTVDLTSAVRYLYRSPLIRNKSVKTRIDRQDVFFIEPGDRDSNKAQTNRALPLDEMNIGKDNGNPFTRYSGVGFQTGTPYTSGTLDCSTVFTLPYWLGRYYGYIKETSPVSYAFKAPAVSLTSDKTTVAAGGEDVVFTAVVSDGANPMARFIVDFYANGRYIGRARTGADGKAAVTAKLSTSVSVTAQATERLVGAVVYTQTDSNAVTITGAEMFTSYGNWTQASLNSSVPEKVRLYVSIVRDKEYYGAQYAERPNVIPVGIGFNTSFMDSARNLWLGTDSGILFVSKTGESKTLAGAERLPYNEIRMMFDDGASGAWVLCGDPNNDMANAVCHIDAM